MNLEIITADTSHVEAISYIGKKSFAVAFENLFNKKEELREYLDYTFNETKLLASIHKENNIYFVALMNNEAVGFAKIKKYSLNQEIDSIAQMELQKLYVLPGQQGSGAGCALMDEVIQLAKQLQPDYLWLDTHVDNSKAISFYKKNGFRNQGKYHFIIGTQTFQYYVMALPVEVLKQPFAKL